MGDLTDRLNAIKALALRDLDNTSDEQIRAEFIEDKQDPSEVASKVAASLARVVERTAASQHAMTAIDAQRSELYALEVKHAELVDQFEAMRQQRDTLRKTLSMLVACKSTEERLKQLHEMGYGTDYDQHRKKFAEAWVDARAALKQPPATP